MSLKDNGGTAIAVEDTLSIDLSSPTQVSGHVSTGVFHPRTGSEGSSQLELSLRNIVKEAAKERVAHIPGLKLKAGLKSADIYKMLKRPLGYTGELPTEEEYTVVGCYPDGGIVFLHGMPICAFEAKAQADDGNAIERWYKNFFILKELNIPSELAYVTFLTGEGAADGAVMSKKIAPALMRAGKRFDHLYPTGLSVIRSVTPFKAEALRNIVDRAINYGLASAGHYVDC